MKRDKGIFQGLKSLTNLNFGFYSKLRSDAKAKAELTFIGEKKVEKVRSQLFVYNEHDVKETEQLKDFSEFEKQRIDPNVLWLNFHGLHDIKLFEALGDCIGIDRFTLRQTLDTTQRPKVEENENYLFFSVKSILAKNGQLHVEHLSFLLGKNYVVSFQEQKGDHFDHIRKKIRENLGMLRKKGSDYLLAQLLDAVLDNYFETLDAINSNIERFGSEILFSPNQNLLLNIESKKKSAETIKKSLKPFLEALNTILDGPTPFVQKGGKKYFRDLKNSCSSSMEEADSSLKSLESLTNIYFSSLTHKMNEIMKVLTTVATIFIPLTFIVGVYGMNFRNMPELEWRYGYFVTLGVMGGIVILMLIYFKRKGWL